MYKVLYLTQFGQIGGGETSLLYLIKHLSKRKFEAHVILPHKGQFYERLMSQKVKVHILNLPPYIIRTFFVPGFSPQASIKLLQLAKVVKPDLISVNHLTLSVYAGIISKYLHIPTIGTAHGNWDSHYPYQNLIYKFFINKIIANTQNTAANLQKHGIYPKKNIQTIHFGIDPHHFRPPTLQEKAKATDMLSIPQNHLVVNCVGRLDPQKDHLTFLRAAKKVIEKRNNVYFLITGSQKGDFSNTKNKYIHSLREFLKTNKDLDKHVKFLNYQKNMQNVYWATDILVSTSSSAAESFGLSLLEAASCQIPIVATKTASQNLIVKNGHNGYLTKPKDTKSIAEKINLLLTNEKLRQEFGKNGRILVSKEFTIETYANKIQFEYLKLIKSKNE